MLSFSGGAACFTRAFLNIYASPPPVRFTCLRRTSTLNGDNDEVSNWVERRAVEHQEGKHVLDYGFGLEKASTCQDSYTAEGKTGAYQHCPNSHLCIRGTCRMFVFFISS